MLETLPQDDSGPLHSGCQLLVRKCLGTGVLPKQKRVHSRLTVVGLTTADPPSSGLTTVAEQLIQNQLFDRSRKRIHPTL